MKAEEIDSTKCDVPKPDPRSLCPPPKKTMLPECACRGAYDRKCVCSTEIFHISPADQTCIKIVPTHMHDPAHQPYTNPKSTWNIMGRQVVPHTKKDPKWVHQSVTNKWWKSAGGMLLPKPNLNGDTVVSVMKQTGKAVSVRCDVPVVQEYLFHYKGPGMGLVKQEVRTSGYVAPRAETALYPFPSIECFKMERPCNAPTKAAEPAAEEPPEAPSPPEKKVNLHYAGLGTSRHPGSLPVPLSCCPKLKLAESPYYEEPDAKELKSKTHWPLCNLTKPFWYRAPGKRRQLPVGNPNDYSYYSMKSGYYSPFEQLRDLGLDTTRAYIPGEVAHIPPHKEHGKPLELVAKPPPKPPLYTCRIPRIRPPQEIYFVDPWIGSDRPNLARVGAPFKSTASKCFLKGLPRHLRSACMPCRI